MISRDRTRDPNFIEIASEFFLEYHKAHTEDKAKSEQLLDLVAEIGTNSGRIVGGYKDTLEVIPPCSK